MPAPQAGQTEALRRRQEERQKAFQPPAEQAVSRSGEKRVGGGKEVEVREVKRKVKEAMKRRKRKS